MCNFVGQLRPGLKDVPLRDTSSLRLPQTCARARKPSRFGSKTNSGESNGSGMRRSRMGVTARSERIGVIVSGQPLAARTGGVYTQAATKQVRDGLGPLFSGLRSGGIVPFAPAHSSRDAADPVPGWPETTARFGDDSTRTVAENRSDTGTRTGRS